MAGHPDFDKWAGELERERKGQILQEPAIHWLTNSKPASLPAFGRNQCALRRSRNKQFCGVVVMYHTI